MKIILKKDSHIEVTLLSCRYFALRKITGCAVFGVIRPMSITAVIVSLLTVWKLERKSRIKDCEGYK
jgi:hypothetical protein